jgi:hypothetical protein
VKVSIFRLELFAQKDRCKPICVDGKMYPLQGKHVSLVCYVPANLT